MHILRIAFAYAYVYSSLILVVRASWLDRLQGLVVNEVEQLVLQVPLQAAGLGKQTPRLTGMQGTATSKVPFQPMHLPGMHMTAKTVSLTKTARPLTMTMTRYTSPCLHSSWKRRRRSTER